jgi:hypothetical protein
MGLRLALLLCAAGAVCSTAWSAQGEEVPDDGRVKLFRAARSPDGGKLTFLWNQKEGPSVKISDPSACRVEKDANGRDKWVSETYFVPKEPGKYVFELTVKNEQGVESKVLVEREVLAPTPPPVAVAGPDQNKTVGEMVRLNGLNSKTPDGKQILQWEWTVVQAPPKFKADARNLKQNAWDFKAEEPGVYQFQLKVSDGKQWSAPSNCVVTIKPKSERPIIEGEDDPKKVELPPGPPPVTPPKRIVKAVVAPGREIKVGETIVLDGSASNPSEDDKPEFFWKQTGGPTIRRLDPNQEKSFSKARSDTKNYPIWNCTPTQAGEYTFVLKITIPDASKEEREIESEPVTYKVAASAAEDVTPVPPPAGSLVAHIEVIGGKVQVDAGETVKLDGSKSKGDGLKYLWGPVEGKRYPKNWAGVDSPKVEFTADEEGEYAVSLVVTDGKDRSAPDQVIIHAGPVNQPPAIKLEAQYETSLISNQEEARAHPLQMKATIVDPEGDKFEVLWSCIDAPNKKLLKIPKEFATLLQEDGKTSTLAFVPPSKGIYVFRLSATDAKGHSSHADTTVNVKGAAEQSPTAKIEGPKSVMLGKKVVLDGSRSSNPNRGTLSYYWKQEDGPPVPGDAPGRKQSKWEFTPKEPGKYVFSLEVSDGASKSQVDKFELVAAKEIHLPIATIKLPGNGKIGEGEELVLDGAESSQTDGDKLTYKWTKIDGTAGLKLDGDDQPQLKITGTTSGTARIQLVVNDGTSDSAPQIVQVVVGKGHAKPVARITGLTSTKPDTIVILSGAESTADDGDVASYLWSQPSDGGPKIKADFRRKELKFKAEQPGTYVLSLVVMDKQNSKSEPVTHTVEVKGVIRPPRAEARVLTDKAEISSGKEVKLSARGSLDPQGGALTYKWKQKSGTPLEIPADAGEVLTVVPNDPGTYVFELTVAAGENESQSVEVSFGVSVPNRPPTAVIAEIGSCEVGDKIVLDGSGSSDPDGDKLEYRWNKVSGPDVNFPRHGDRSAKTELALTKEGEYVFELKVFDGKVWSEPARAAVKTKAANVPPIAAFSQPQIRTEENMETVLDASASSDPDNGPKPLTYTWRQKDGAKVELHTDGTAYAKFTPIRTGSLSFEVIANDGKANSPPAVVRVEVLKSGTLPIAIPISKPPSPAKVSHRETRDNVLILDGTQSKPHTKPLTYQWKQIGGVDLHLPADRLTKDRIGLLVFIAGDYKFSLVVSDGTNTSQPTFIEIKVVDDGTAQSPENKPEPKKEEQPEKTQGPEPHKDGALLPPPKDAKSIEVTSTNDSAGDNSTTKKQLEELAKKPGAEAEKTLIAALSNSDKEIRTAAAEALYRRGVNSIPALISVLDSGDSVAKGEAYWALKELTHETFGPEANKWKDWWSAQPAAAKAPRE